MNKLQGRRKTNTTNKRHPSRRCKLLGKFNAAGVLVCKLCTAAAAEGSSINFPTYQKLRDKTTHIDLLISPLGLLLEQVGLWHTEKTIRSVKVAETTFLWHFEICLSFGEAGLLKDAVAASTVWNSQPVDVETGRGWIYISWETVEKRERKFKFLPLASFQINYTILEVMSICITLDAN